MQWELVSVLRQTAVKEYLGSRRSDRTVGLLTVGGVITIVLTDIIRMLQPASGDAEVREQTEPLAV